MALIKYEPAARLMRPEFFSSFFGNDLMEGFLREFEGTEMKFEMPKVEVSETKKKYKITADLPGYDKDEINVKVEDDVLSIRAERKHENKEEKEGYYRSESYYGVFNRSFRIPEEVEPENIKAKMKDGVLKLTLPKTKEVEPEAEVTMIEIK